MLEDIKTVLGIDISDITQDILLNIYVRKSKTLIKKYLNITDETIDIETLYIDAIIEYVAINYNKRGNEGIKQYAQGSRSGTYGDDLPQSVKDLLPVPYLRMMG